MWKRIGKLCEWKEPRAPEVRLLFDDVRATTAGRHAGPYLPAGHAGGEDSSQALRRRSAGDGGREVDREGEEAGPAPP